MTDKEKDQNMRDYLHWLLSQFPKEEIKYDTNWKRFDKDKIK